MGSANAHSGVGNCKLADTSRIIASLDRVRATLDERLAARSSKGDIQK